MSRARAGLVVAAALVGWALAYALPSTGMIPTLYLDPQPGRWSLGARPSAVAMGYYGQLLWGLGGAAVGALVGGLAPVPAGRGVGLAAAWALSALLLSGAWFTWSNWP